MSLFSNCEICETCKDAVFHQCCGSFCYCKADHADEVDYIKGNCEFKREHPDMKQEAVTKDGNFEKEE